MFFAHWNQDYLNNCFSSFWNSYEMCKRIAFFLNYCSHKMNKFLIQNINLACDIYIESIYPISTFSCQAVLANKLYVYLSWTKFSLIYFSCLSALTNPHVDLSCAKFSSSLVDIKIGHNQSKLVSSNQSRSFIEVI